VPITIVIQLAATPLLTLSLLDGTAWSPGTLVLGQLALAAAVVTVVAWVIMDAVLTVAHRWARFISKPY
jgi:hypothetical protein